MGAMESGEAVGAGAECTSLRGEGGEGTCLEPAGSVPSTGALSPIASRRSATR